MKRKLAAVMVAEMVDYSRRMNVDETGTLATLKACRTEVIEPRWHTRVAAWLS